MLGLVRRLLGIAPPRPSVDAAQWRRVERTLPFLEHLAPADRPRLREMALAFLARKEFHGAQGLRLDDDMLLAIALQACLPVLNIGLQAYDGWVGVVVYPGDFVIPRQEFDEAGVLHEYDDEVLGEAWEGGPVLLSWFAGDDGPAGVNVVIHEFAHKLDMENGGVDGLPRLPAHMSRQAWAAAFGAAYEAFCAEVDRGADTVIDPYGAEHPAEFFAVVSEIFFEHPCALRMHYPEVYAQLMQFYGMDTAARAAAAGDR
ncbi:M90 family metallopeptidase [Thauera sp.]|jgi:Mlc titration factor MtfA (ptsG expression regulator)|uniref:M90 family metallopeptidase n=1 Tax=Thauera sp. TaxID=1905334 RepID=UPI0026368686|nr:M90 family metallopeptidase [Thauera sp.]MCK6408955.1 zinc-dependent peptidase [Thauera sp.]